MMMFADMFAGGIAKQHPAKISLMVLPSPFPLSGSSLVTCVMNTEPMPMVRSQVSLAALTRLAIGKLTYRWSGGVSGAGVETPSCGGVLWGHLHRAHHRHGSSS